MAIQGLRDTTNFVTDQRPKNWREGILLLYPNGQAPLTGLTSLMGKARSVDDPEYNWWDKEVSSRRFAITVTITAATAFLTMASGAKNFKEGDILKSEQTDEIVAVTSDPTTDLKLDVSRGFAGSSAAAITFNANNINPNWVCIGSAMEEGSLAPTGVSLDPTKRFNYTQIFRNTLEATRTAINTRLRTGDAIKEAKRETLELHSMDMERAFWLGKKTETTKNGKPQRTTDGIVNFIDSANVKTATSDYPSGVTMTGLEEYFYNIFKYGSSEKMGWAGNRSLLTIQQIIRKNATWNFESGLKEFGMNVSRITSPFGEIVLKTHPQFNQLTGGTTGTGPYYGMESWLVVLDMTEVKYVHLKGGDTKYEPELQANGMDGLKSGYLTEAGLEVHHPKTHYLIKSLAASAIG